MGLPFLPSPCPELRPGLALGAPEHQGFVAFWNWLVAIFRRAKDYFVLGVNGIKGEVRIVGGEGISVCTAGQTISISLGEGDSTDKESPPDTSGGGGGNQTDPEHTDEPFDVPGGGEGDQPGAVTTVPKEVVVGVEWNAATHEFMMIKETVLVVAYPDAPAPVKSTVFKATLVGV